MDSGFIERTLEQSGRFSDGQKTRLTRSRLGFRFLCDRLFAKARFRLIACFALLCGFSGCAITDPRAAALEPYAETQSSPAAVVGLWHSKSPTGMTQTFLIKEDGRMYVKIKWGSMDPQMNVAEYWYAGNGIWKWSYQRGTFGAPTFSFKRAKEFLISYNGFGQPIGVMTQQKSETATSVAAGNGAAMSSETPPSRPN